MCTALVSLYVLYVNFYYGLGYFPSLFGVQEAPFAVLSLITFLYECSGIVCALGGLGLEAFQALSIVLSLGYFVCNGAALVISLKKTTKSEVKTHQKIQTGKEATP